MIITHTPHTLLPPKHTTTPKALFAKRLPDPRGCVLAVCIRREKEREGGTGDDDDGSGALRALVCGCVFILGVYDIVNALF